MSKKMNWDTFAPTREIKEYDRKFLANKIQSDLIFSEI